jgi:CubicO group peptidase (beta-lactamase class C family)
MLFMVSCNRAGTSGTDTIDSLAVLKIPVAGTVSAAETERIKKACQLWYDSVLKPRGFNGGILVAKDGNIIFEQYSGTGHIPGTDLLTENSPLHIASITKTFTAMAVL